MTAIITEKTRRDLATSIFDQLDNVSNEFYIGLGRTEEWANGDVAPTPTVTSREEQLFRYSVHSLSKIVDYSFVVPKFTWVSGSIYAAYNDNVEGHPVQSYYVLTTDNNVYICLKQGKDAAGIAVASIAKPDHVDTTLTAETDGYVWKYMFTLTTDNYSKFVTSGFMPVQDAATAVASAATPGQILGYRVVDGGSGFTSTPSVSITGNGSSAAATAVRFGDRIVEVYPTNYGSGYDYASVTLTGGGGSAATIVPIFGPAGGLGANTKDDLRVSAVMTKSEFTSDGTGSYVINNDYRQVGVIKNPTAPSSSTVLTGNSYRALKTMVVSNATGFQEDLVMTQGSASAYIDYVDGTTVWYHQTETTGFANFQTGSGLTVGANSTSIVSLGNAEADPFSGEILYIDNRAAITRTTTSNDDIRLVFQI